MKENYAVVDVETTTFQKGNPYADRNRLCAIGIRSGGRNSIFRIDGSGEPYASQIHACRLLLAGVLRVVVFNGKFDFAWLHRYGIEVDHAEIWDCQLCEFLLSNQTGAYPSLQGSCARFGRVAKADSTVPEYWKAGLDTPQIPWTELEKYLAGDLEDTDALYQQQVQHLPASKRPLFQVQCEDLLCLMEMERNGIRLDEAGLQKKSDELQVEMDGIRAKMGEFTHDWPHFNFSSGDHLSCLLFGGTVSVDIGTPYEHTYKGGAKKGLTEVRHRWQTETKTYEPLFEPDKDWELAKGGVYSTDANTVLRQLPKHKLVKWLLEYSELEKLKTTYTDKLVQIRAKYDWLDGNVHGTYNQCVVITGRLSSEKPNLQNNPKEIDEYIVSRYPGVEAIPSA